jgi:hypothetical protein
MNYREYLRTRIITVGLAVIAALSIFQGYIGTIVQLPENWYVPIILAALAIILEATVDVRKINSNVESLVERSDLSRTRVYQEHDKLLSDFLDDLRKTTGEVKLSRIKSDAPSEYQSPNAESFHDELATWCEKHPATHVKRIMTVSNQRTFEWAVEQARLTDEYPNLYVRVIEREADFDMVNPAILGDSDVYFSFTYDTTETARGMYVNDPAVAELYVEYFENIWQKGTPVSDYVTAHSDEYES